MARLDKIHDKVKNALIKDGWTITHDPFAIQFEELDLYVDLAAERVFAAERADEKIAVEIKSFCFRQRCRILNSRLDNTNFTKNI